MTTSVYSFFDAEADEDIPVDSSPPLENVEYPCEVCGKEAGPYGGRGRKPKRCSEHKKNQSKASSPRITGNAATLAAQATQVLVQYNGFAAMGCMAMQYYKTASSIAEANSLFEQQIHQALLTDTELCKTILKSGNMSTKATMTLAYASFMFTVLPTLYMEYKDKKASREVALENE